MVQFVFEDSTFGKSLHRPTLAEVAGLLGKPDFLDRQRFHAVMSWWKQCCCCWQKSGWRQHHEVKEEEDETQHSTDSHTSLVAEGESSVNSEDMGKVGSKISQLFKSAEPDDKAATSPMVVAPDLSSHIPQTTIPPTSQSVTTREDDGFLPDISPLDISSSATAPISTPLYPLATPRSPLRHSPLTTDHTHPAPKRLKEDVQYLDYPILNHSPTITFIQDSKIMLIMKGVPGSGKTFLAHKILETYPEAVVCSADHYFMNDREYQFDPTKLKEAHESSQERARKAAESGTHVIIIDNTNVRNWEMKAYLDIARDNCYFPLVLEPQTPWALKPKQLALKNQHDIPEHILKKKVKSYQHVQPIYYGWFLNEADSASVENRAMDCLQEALGVTQFAKKFTEIFNLDSPQDLLNIYSRAQFRDGGNILHCTAKFTARGKSEEATEYMESAVVKGAMGSCFDLSIVAFVITPRTFGARLKLTDSELDLWGQNDDEQLLSLPNRDENASPKADQNTEKENASPKADQNTKNNVRKSVLGLKLPTSVCKSTVSEVAREDSEDRFHPTSGKGIRAHLTLACAPGVKPVTTGFDLVNLVKQEKESLTEPDKLVGSFQLTGGVLRNYGEGMWAVYLDRVIQVKSMFSAYY